MFCSNCGMKLVDGAKFCHKCGTPVMGGAKQQNIKWEHCQIGWQYVKASLFKSKKRSRFFAEAVSSSKGKYTVGEVQYQGGNNYGPAEDEKERARAKDSHNELVQMLVNDGWEPVSERGEYWWQLRFKRRG